MKAKCARFLTIAWIFLAIGCAHTKQAPPPATRSFQTEMARARYDIRRHYNKAAVRRLSSLVSRDPQSGTDEAYLLLGHLYYRAADYTKSYRAFISVLNWQFKSPLETQAKIGAARALFKLSRYDEALNFTKMLLKQDDLPANIRLEANYLQYNIQWELGDRLDALRSLVYLAENDNNSANRERYHIRAMDIVDSSLTDQQIATVANDPTFEFVQLPALYHVGVQAFEGRDYDNAESFLQKLISKDPNSDLAQSAKKYVQQIEARRQVAPYTIGAVLPLSSKDEMISESARRTLRGLELGLGIFDKHPSNFKLAVLDSEGNPDVARRDVERLVVEDNVIAIVGDLLSRTAQPVAEKADELGVPDISLSQKLHLTDVGENVFQNALTGSALVKELVQTAMNKYGMRRFAILYPNDGYGVEYANLFWDEVSSLGGTIAGAQIYAQNETDFHGSVSRLLGTFYLEARDDEYVSRLKKWYHDQRQISPHRHISIPDDILPPVVDFDAIFIPDDVKALGQITSRLSASDVGDNVWLLGTNLWNTQSLIDRGTQMADKTLFVDSTGVVDNSFTRTKFYSDYQSMFGEPPSVFEAQAFDTGRILKSLIDNGARSRPSLREALLTVRQFHGLVGDISVDSDREFTRPLTVLSAKGGKIAPADMH